MRTRTITFDADGLAHAGELVQAEGSAWTVVLCHGIPGGTPDPADPGYAGLAREIAARGYAAFWFNFRGCRDAPGDFSMAGWVRDLSSALDALSAATPAPIAVVGSSAGGAAALRACVGREDVAAVATLAAPADFGALSEEPDSAILRFRTLGIIRDPAFPANRDAWAREFVELAPMEAAASLAPRPLLIVHGDADDVVPYPHAEMLFERASQPKELVRIPGGGHQLRKDARALDAVLDWLDRRAGSLPVRPDRSESPRSAGH